MKKEIRNLPASIHQRLINLARLQGRTFQDVYYSYAMERFLYRLSISEHANSFILKGAVMFVGWGIPLRRHTRDIDVQGYQENSVENLVAMVKYICDQDGASDGIRFPSESVRGERIMNTAEYQGVRIYFDGYLGEAFVQLHLDVSFANIITPSKINFKYPTLLEMPSFLLNGYPYETAIAEKFQSMVKFEYLNNRIKDFFDIWLLSQQLTIQGSTLSKAIKATFDNRKTPLPTTPPAALTNEFGIQKQPEWERFLRRSNLEVSEYPSFEGLICDVSEFLWPAVLSLIEKTPFEVIWDCGGPWISTNQETGQSSLGRNE